MKLLAPQPGNESCQPNDDTSVKAECANDNTTANSNEKKQNLEWIKGMMKVVYTCAVGRKFSIS